MIHQAHAVIEDSCISVVAERQEAQVVVVMKNSTVFLKLITLHTQSPSGAPRSSRPLPRPAHERTIRALLAARTTSPCRQAATAGMVWQTTPVFTGIWDRNLTNPIHEVPAMLPSASNFWPPSRAFFSPRSSSKPRCPAVLHGYSPLARVGVPCFASPFVLSLPSLHSSSSSTVVYFACTHAVPFYLPLQAKTRRTSSARAPCTLPAKARPTSRSLRGCPPTRPRTRPSSSTGPSACTPCRPTRMPQWSLRSVKSCFR